MLNVRRDNNEKKLKQYWSVLVNYYLKLLALVWCCIELIYTSSNNYYWNDNKPVLKIPMVLSFSGLVFLNTNLRFTGDPPKCFLHISKIENKKAVIWNIRV